MGEAEGKCGCSHASPSPSPSPSPAHLKPKRRKDPSGWRLLRWRRLLSSSSSSPAHSSTSSTSSPPSTHCHSPRPLLRNSEVHLKWNGRASSRLVDEPALELVEPDGAAVSRAEETPKEQAGEPRETWDRRLDFLLSIVGFAVDLANVWRFPFLCYRNGGGAFLIPYFVMLIFGALPLFYMELLLGQFHRQGPISVWNICPLFKGTGYCAVLVAYFVSFYYNVIIGWSFYYMFASFSLRLPWLDCDNSWNTPSCVDAATANLTSFRHNRTSAAKEYFERGVLELHSSEGVHDLGAPKWQLCACVLLVYVLLYLSLLRGVRSSGKVVWVTATVPYLVLAILLVRGLLLPGAREGVLYFLRPDMGRLAHTQVWVDAAVQVFYSVGAGFGVHLTFASYNSFHNDCYRDCIITTAINSFTSLFSGLVIFTYLGYMAWLHDTDISRVATEGPGLVFEVYPEAISTLPWSNFWAFIFFFMLITLGMDSTMGGLESVITGFKDEFQPFFAKFRYSREIFTAIIMAISFLVANLNLTRGGGYMLHWFDTYSAGISLLCSALFEAIGVSWFYGLERFSADVRSMLGSAPSLYWRICWKFLSPFFLLAVITSAIVNRQPLRYNDYVYPAWAELLGWLFALLSVAAIPLAAGFTLYHQKANTCKQKFALSITPPGERQQMLAGHVTRFKKKHWLTC